MGSRPCLASLPPPTRPPLLLLLLLLLPANALGVNHDYEDDDEHKDVSTSSGHSLVLDLSSLSVLAALKLKFVVVLLIAAAVFVLLTKGYNTKCLFGNCRPNYSTYGYYPYVDYSYVGYEVPAGSSAAYRRPLPVVAKDSPHLSDLTARVWNSIDIAGMAFSALNIQEDDCRRKLVCQADRAADRNPLLRAALSWFSASLARYRTDRSRPGAEFVGDGGGGAEWRQEDPCEVMYPRCLHRDLPPALGGPETQVYLEQGDTLHLHTNHDHLGEPLPPVSQSYYRDEYRYEYPPLREEEPEESRPAVDALFPTAVSTVFAVPVHSLVQASVPTTSYTSNSPAALASPSAAPVRPAPVREGTDVPANVSTAVSSVAGSVTTGAAGGSRSPDKQSSLDSEPRMTSERPTRSAATPDAKTPLVWRRVLFGRGDRRKVHYE